MPKKIVDTDRQLLLALREGSEVLQNITDQFAPLMKRFRIFFFWEQQKTALLHTREYVVALILLLGLRAIADSEQIVDESSAAPIIDNTERAGIDADHRHMCKFSDRGSFAYRTVAEALRRYTSEASPLIAQRTSEAREMLNRQRYTEASELTGVS